MWTKSWCKPKFCYVQQYQIQGISNFPHLPRKGRSSISNLPSKSKEHQKNSQESSLLQPTVKDMSASHHKLGPGCKLSQGQIRGNQHTTTNENIKVVSHRHHLSSTSTTAIATTTETEPSQPQPLQPIGTTATVIAIAQIQPLGPSLIGKCTS